MYVTAFSALLLQHLCMSLCQTPDFAAKRLEAYRAYVKSLVPISISCEWTAQVFGSAEVISYSARFDMTTSFVRSFYDHGLNSNFGPLFYDYKRLRQHRLSRKDGRIVEVLYFKDSAPDPFPIFTPFEAMGLVVRSYAFRSLPDVMDKGTFLRAERLRMLRHGAEQILIEFRDEQGDRHELVFAENIPGCFVSHRRIMEATTPRKPQEKPCIRIIENVEFTEKNGLYIPTYMRMGYKNFIPGKEDSEPGHLRVTRFDFRTDLSLARILDEEAEASVIDMRTLEMRPSKAARKEGLARLKEQIRKTNEHLAKEFQEDESKRVMAVPNELSAKVIAAIVAGIGGVVIVIAVFVKRRMLRSENGVFISYHRALRHSFARAEQRERRRQTILQIRVRKESVRLACCRCRFAAFR